MTSPLRPDSNSSADNGPSGPPPVHLTVNWNENRSRLAHRLGVHTSYLDPKLYTIPFDLSLAPQASVIVHYGDRGDHAPPSYAVHRLVHREVHPLHQVETCLGLTNEHLDNFFVLRAQAPLDTILENQQIHSFILLGPKEGHLPLTVWDFM